jgi:hypothetical protein
MKKTFRSFLIFVAVLSLHFSPAFATTVSDIEKLQVSGGQGNLIVEAEELSQLTITIKNEQGKLLVSELVDSKRDQFELTGLAKGLYEVEVKNKKTSKIFRVEVK